MQRVPIESDQIAKAIGHLPARLGRLVLGDSGTNEDDDGAGLIERGGEARTGLVLRAALETTQGRL